MFTGLLAFCRGGKSGARPAYGIEIKQILRMNKALTVLAAAHTVNS
jgi:hypothetical protein